MAVDYFAHAVYGVVLEGDPLDLLEAFIDEGLTTEEEAAEAIARINRGNPGILEQVKEKVGAPPYAHFYWTGSEDERPGRCDTDAGLWVVGFSLFCFPSNVERWDGADWHSWVSSC
jgi:hypothetical protein